MNWDFILGYLAGTVVAWVYWIAPMGEDIIAMRSIISKLNKQLGREDTL